MSSDRVRSSTYSYILYPENLSIEEIKHYLIDEFQLDFALSPLHTGDDIKDHYHLLVFYPNPVSYNTAVRIGERVKSPKKILYPANVIGAMRYLIHADDPDKQQFKKEDIFIHGLKAKKIFINAFSDIELKRVASTFRSIHNYIVDNDIDDIFMLQQYLLNTDFESFQLVQQNYNYFKSVCQFHNHRMNMVNDIDLDITYLGKPGKKNE